MLMFYEDSCFVMQNDGAKIPFFAPMQQ